MRGRGEPTSFVTGRGHVIDSQNAKWRRVRVFFFVKNGGKSIRVFYRFFIGFGNIGLVLGDC